MGWSIKKPLGGKNSVVRQVVSNPVTAVLPTTGLALTAAKSALGPGEYPSSPMDSGELFDQRATEEEARRKQLGEQQRQQILGFASEFETSAANRRAQLANMLAGNSASVFERANPYILQDLNARGVYTSPTAVAQAQAEALKDLELENQNRLAAFDTDVFNQMNDIRGTALSSQLGGDQDALDAALELRRAKLNRTLDVQDQDREERLARYLARRQSRDSLIASLIGGASRLGGAAIAA